MAAGGAGGAVGGGAGGGGAGATVHALPLIYQRPNSKTWELGEEALAFLDRLDQPVSVVIVAGRYRSGKSFLLNQLLSGNGFVRFGG
jgi:Guanylate-binding protein, N-terminal domain